VVHLGNKLCALNGTNSQLRILHGMDVQVGNHLPIPGGPAVAYELNNIIDAANDNKNSAYALHHKYETLHPLTDGNGRTGRMIWLWMMKPTVPSSFLHLWYYQSLENNRVL
jgi:Fic family protein